MIVTRTIKAFKMKNILWILAVGLTLSAFYSCQDDGDDEVKDGTLKLTFKAVYDGEPAVVNSEEYEYFDGKKLKLATLNLFVSKPTLSMDQQNAEELTDIFFVDFSQANRTAQGAQDGISYTWELAPGEYNTLNMGLGVSSDLNALLPTDYPTDHPLNEFGSQAYWTPWNSFIFSKIEGRYDKDGDNSFATGFAYHIGSDNMYREKETNGNFTIKAEEETEWVITIDYRQVLGDPAEYIDIEQFPAFHSPQDPTLTQLTMMLANNFEKAVQITQE